ncbi:MAG: hypothetical protein M3N54_12135 [Acidobacteriota bacterium]|nr:hypothetical protein [Acidobacteriota bacterium]
MKTTILTLVFALGTLPAGFAQTQANSSTEKTEEHAATTVNPDGTAVHSAAATHEKVESANNADGSTSTVKSRQTTSHTKVKKDVPAPVVDSTTTEHHSSTTSTTTTTNP